MLAWLGPAIGASDLIVFDMGGTTATAAIVAEFVGANKGLGYVLLRGTSTMDIELTFAVLVVLTIIGIAVNYLVEFSEWVMTPPAQMAMQ